jgi:hypothetical protein
MASRTSANALLGLVCVLIWLGLMGFGLWPFNFFPRNHVEWLGHTNGIHFNGYGEVYGAVAGQFSDDTGSVAGSHTVEVWLNPWEKVYPEVTAIFSVDNPSDSPNFAVLQSGPDLLIRGRFLDRNANHVVVRKLWMDDACRKGEPRFITLTSGPDGSALYLEGVLQKTYPLALISDNLSGRILIGHPPAGNQEWTGDLLGVAIYNRALTDHEVLKHYEDWQNARFDDLAAADTRISVLYPFNERTGKTVHNHTGAGPDLFIPHYFRPIRKNALSPDLDIHLSDLYDIVVNIVGFMPFGFFGYAYLRYVRGIGSARSTFSIIVLGALTSLAIEVLQVYLPTRDSSLLDVINNTLGSALGAVAMLCLGRWSLVRKKLAFD